MSSKTKQKIDRKKIIITIVLALTIIAGVFGVNKVITSYVIKSEIPDSDWLQDNCECVEREKLKCPGEFKLDVEKRMCRKATVVCPEKGEIVLYDKDCKEEVAWTNVLLGCSKYNCTGEIYEVK